MFLLFIFGGTNSVWADTIYCTDRVLDLKANGIVWEHEAKNEKRAWAPSLRNKLKNKKKWHWRDADEQILIFKRSIFKSAAKQTEPYMIVPKKHWDAHYFSKHLGKVSRDECKFIRHLDTDAKNKLFDTVSANWTKTLEYRNGEKVKPFIVKWDVEVNFNRNYQVLSIKLNDEVFEDFVEKDDEVGRYKIRSLNGTIIKFHADTQPVDIIGLGWPTQERLDKRKIYKAMSTICKKAVWMRNDKGQSDCEVFRWDLQKMY